MEQLGDIYTLKGYDKNGNLVIEFEGASLAELSITSNRTHIIQGKSNQPALSFDTEKILEFTGTAKKCNLVITKEEAFKELESQTRPVSNEAIVKPKQKDDYKIFNPIFQFEDVFQNIGVVLRNIDGSFRNIIEILADISEKWEKLEDDQKTILTEILDNDTAWILPTSKDKPIKIAFEGKSQDFSLDAYNNELNETLNNLINQIKLG